MANTYKPRSSGKRRILVVANETLEGRALRDVITLSTDSTRPAQVFVVAPALNSRLHHWLSDEDDARRSAGLRLAASVERLRAAGIDAEGRVGDPGPLQAITDALREFRAHKIVIAQREGRSHWLTRDLVGRARRRFAQPVVQVGVLDGEEAAA
jgi:nucleotide-binding universal stress UspA family protein